jgi:hypothetical protein
MDGECRTHGRDKYIKNLVAKHEGKKQSGRHRLIWEHKIKTVVRETGW